MAQYVKVASILFSAGHWRGQPEARARALSATTEALDGLRGLGLDLVVTCESVEAMAQTLDQAESLDAPGDVLEMYSSFAASERCHVAGSVKLREGHHVYNSIAFIGPDGQALGAYHKTFLTRAEIQRGLTPGAGAVCVDTAIGRLGGSICFDLNFEPLRRQYEALQPDILAFSSNYHGGLVQGLWAYACRSFFVSALPFHGGGILDPFGRAVVLTDCYTPVARACINIDRVMVHLDNNRAAFPRIERAYAGEVCIDIPPNVGSALIYSLSPDRRAVDIAREFELVLLDDYLETSLVANRAARPQAASRRGDL